MSTPTWTTRPLTTERLTLRPWSADHAQAALDVCGHAEVTAICVVCPHPWHEHDPLGVRYCTATTASALSRGCICR